MDEARYDGLAEWYDREFATGRRAEVPRDAVLRLLGAGEGRLLDVGCGTGAHAVAIGDQGWKVTGVDISEDQLRLARARGVEAVRADAAVLPFADASFDAVVSTWTHTDVDDFVAVVAEVARFLRPGGPFVYVGGHPCFVGPHSRFVAGQGVPELHSGYDETDRYFTGPGVTSDGVRRRVGAMHLPLGLFLTAFLQAGLVLERFEELEESGAREYPSTIALRWRR